MNKQLQEIHNVDNIKDILNFNLSQARSEPTNVKKSPVKADNRTNQNETSKTQDTSNTSSVNTQSGSIMDEDSKDYSLTKRFFANHESFGEFGELKKSSKVIELIGKEADYYTTVRKHMFEECLICEFKIKNNEAETDLQNVTVDFTINNNSENLQISEIVSNKVIASGNTGAVYVVVAKNPSEPVINANFSVSLNFRASVKDSDGNEVNDYEDTFP